MLFRKFIEISRIISSISKEQSFFLIRLPANILIVSIIEIMLSPRQSQAIFIYMTEY